MWSRLTLTWNRLAKASITLALLACCSCASESLREPGVPLAVDAGPSLPTFGDRRREIIDPLANACGSDTIRPGRVPLDLIFVVDTSGSMLDDTASGLSKWEAFRAAFSTFARAPESSGVSASMGFFPLIQPGVPDECTGDAQCGSFGPCTRPRACAGAPSVSLCDSDAACGSSGPCVALGVCRHQAAYCGAVGERCSARADDICEPAPGRCVGRDVCSSGTYAQAISDPVALPAGANTLADILARQIPRGITPTAPALMGAIERARASLLAHQDRRVAIVLATDGFPTDCSPQSIEEIAKLLEQAALASPGIPVFVLGVFTPQEEVAASLNLSRLAHAGGTPAPLIVSTTGDTSNALLAALNDIRATALACDYEIPEADRGQLDLDQVNVRFGTANGTFFTIGHVPNAAACDPTKGGWYYEVTPGSGQARLIKVCSATCDKLRSEPRGRVDLVVGCKTVPVE